MSFNNGNPRTNIFIDFFRCSRLERKKKTKETLPFYCFDKMSNITVLVSHITYSYTKRKLILLQYDI